MMEKQNLDKIKKDMMELWTETFHDSPRYVKLVFDTYFTPDNIFFRYNGDRLISALLGVPYIFSSNDSKNKRTHFKGLYLCGLATSPEWRKKGIMSQLMEEAERAAEQRDYDITFLIPADAHLREYYEKKGYKTKSYRQRFTVESSELPVQEEKSKMYIYTIKDFFNDENHVFLEELAEWCSNIEKNGDNANSILHSTKDMKTVMIENENSFFLTNSSFNPKYPILAKVEAVGFPEFLDDKNGTLRILGWFDQGKIKNRDLYEWKSEVISGPITTDAIYAIVEHYSCQRIEFLLPTVEDRIMGRREPYAMVKAIGNRCSSNEFENRNFKIYLMLD